MRSISFLGLFFHVFYNAQCAYITERVDPLVYIDQGLVRGEKFTDGDYSAFLGVPYAQVDMENPFGPPLPAPHFDGIFRAFDGSIKCPQISTASSTGAGTLDCLRLNILVPSKATTKNPLPVIIWFHGGSFKEGSSEVVIAKNLVKEGVIVVGVNYRLGPYGFLCLDHPSVPGNQGLKDQYEAIRWVRQNIAAFGGNPYEVTIAGQDAGSSSVLLQLYAKNERLFNKVIAQSGTPLNDDMFVKKDVQAAIKLAAYLGFETTDTEQALQFLTKTAPELVVGAAKEINLNLKPCKENIFADVDAIVAENPYALVNENKVSKTSILIGHTSKEANPSSVDKNTDPFYVKIRDNFNMNEQEVIKAAEFVRHFYVGDEELTEDLISVLGDFETDFTFAHSVQITVNSLLQQNPVSLYQYVFSYAGATGISVPDHGADLKYLFKKDVLDNDKDRLLSDRITTLWANFVKYGNPTPQPTDLLLVTWEPVTENSRPYLEIDTDLKLGHRLFKERMTFWELFYERYGQYHVFAQE